MRLTSLSLFISSPSFSLWLQDTCHLMPFTKYSLLDQSYFFTSCLSIAHIKFTNKIHQLFTDYLLRLPYSELLETHLFRSRANRRLVFPNSVCLGLRGLSPAKGASGVGSGWFREVPVILEVLVFVPGFQMGLEVPGHSRWSPIEFPLQNGRCRPSYKWFI